MKPGDFFVGVTDIFSILLSGVMLAFVLMKAEEAAYIDVFDLLKVNGTPGYAAFLVCAYFLGHLLDTVGSASLDRLYDLFCADLQRYELQAGSKFFRSVAVGSLLLGVILLRFPCMVHIKTYQIGISCALLAVFAFVRFCNLRWKAV